MEIHQSNSFSVVSYETSIHVDSNKLWEVIATPGILEDCHPFCAKNEVIQWIGVGSKDKIRYYNGFTLQRYFTRWEIGDGYELLIGVGRYAAANVKWEVIKDSSSTSKLRITIKLYKDIALKRYPKFFRSVINRWYFSPHMTKYVKSVVKGFKYFIESGKPVEKNQFGRNPLFSA